MNIVFIVPTGIGAEIGGHSGDATPAAKLIASVCDYLLVHPNVVNASDINEMTENMLYVEGSILDRFLEGLIGLEETNCNKILVAVNKPVTIDTVNAVSGARATIGADIEIVEFDYPLRMTAQVSSDGKASGEIYNLDHSINQVSKHEFDVLVVNTPIDINEEEAKKYLSMDGGTNIWGGVEAILSKSMSEKLNRPVIHSPVETNEILRTLNKLVDPRKAAEMVSVCYLHCCLKGGHVAPKITLNENALWNTDIDFLISPINVFGRPHLACCEAGIPIIYVSENKTVLDDPMPKKNSVIVENYLEAAGVIAAKKAGITLESISRPLARTIVHYSNLEAI